MWRTHACPPALGVLVSLLALIPVSASVEWDTEFQKSFQYRCPSGSYLSYMYSEHDNDLQDRRWSFDCTDTGSAVLDCFWANYTAYDCDTADNFPSVLGGIFEADVRSDMSSAFEGITSYFSDQNKDRQFTLRLCRFEKH